METPVSFTIDISQAIAQRNFDIFLYWAELPKSGYCAALEQPGQYLHELQTCSRKVQA